MKNEQKQAIDRLLDEVKTDSVQIAELQAEYERAGDAKGVALAHVLVVLSRLVAAHVRMSKALRWVIVAQVAWAVAFLAHLLWHFSS